MRSSHALALAALLAALAATLVWWLGSGPEPSPDLAVMATTPRGAASEVAGASPFHAQRVPAPADAGPLRELGDSSGATPPPVTPVEALVDVYYFWGDGQPIGNLEMATDSAGTRAVWPCVLAPGAQGSGGATLLERGSSSLRTDPGWFTSIARPVAPIEVGLALGGEVLARERVEPDDTSVRVTVDRARVSGALCTVRGRIPGLAEAASYVLVWPPTTGPLPVTGRRATGEGEAFQVTGLPPGRQTLALQGSPDQVRADLFALAKERGLTAVSAGRRVPNDEQWRLRLDYLRTRRAPSARLRLDLSEGEVRDLGALEFERSGAVLLQLTDETGAPLAAGGSQVVPLESPKPDHVRATVPWVWTFESRIALAPLGPGPVELLITQLDRAALVSVTPGDALEVRPVTLERLSVLQVPVESDGDGGGGQAVRVATIEGRALVHDRRWVGSSYRGTTVGPGTWLLPPGVYRIEGLGAPRSIVLPPEHRIDLREGSRFDGPLEPLAEGR